MELRTRVYETECRFYCEKCAKFLDQGQEKNPNWTYLSKEEFEKITDYIVDDSVLNVMSMDQILSIMLAINDFEGAFKYFRDQKDRTDATVKFFGEMVPSGPMNRFISPEDRVTQRTESLHQCNNPSCKFEIVLPRDYPYVDRTVGRMIRSPDELQHPDDVIKNVTKKHIGSTVTPNFQEQKPKVENEPEKIQTVEETVTGGKENPQGT